ncbi:MAG: aminotransferase class I/II-fold pyridoxal phosphate-dependent enzyme [Pirellulales bacterium]|nr:aminotransferase class I/II-fold pyridoxal phosphate-dependent enzyme [Pirellulales bacterium]
MSGYVPGEQPREGDVVKLNTNENPYPCSPTVKAAIGRVCQAGLQKYPDPAATEFRAAAAELFAADVPGITPEWVLCGNGSDDLLTIVTRACVGAGDHVRFPRPSYVLYDTLAAIQGATCDVVDFEPDWTLGPRFVRPCDKLRLAYLPNPNSPSGTVLAPAEVGRIAAALPCPLIVDEAYADFAEENCLRLVAENQRVIVTRTLSKSYALAGLRFGFAIAQPQVIAELVKVKDSYNCDALAIAGATAALRDRPWFDRTRAAVLATRQRLLAELRRLGFACVDSQANFVWCRPPGGSPRGLYESLKRANILVRYMPYGDWGDGLRVTVGTDAQIDVLLAKLDELI